MYRITPTPKKKNVINKYLYMHHRDNTAVTSYVIVWYKTCGVVLSRTREHRLIWKYLVLWCLDSRSEGPCSKPFDSLWRVLVFAMSMDILTISFNEKWVALFCIESKRVRLAIKKETENINTFLDTLFFTNIFNVHRKLYVCVFVDILLCHWLYTFYIFFFFGKFWLHYDRILQKSSPSLPK